jgi:hypothetical protein
MTKDRSTTKQQFVSLLRHFTRQIQAMDDEDVQRILDGELELEIRTTDRRARSSGKRQRCSDEEMIRLRDSLGRVRSRECALELIDRTLQSKTDLARFAKAIDVPVPKEASTNDVRDRLVEATVGYRIRSAAIRGDKRVLPTHQATEEATGNRCVRNDIDSLRN